MNIRAILFDLDDTLTDDTGSMKKSVTATADFICEYYPQLSADAVFDAYWRESGIVWDAFAAEQANGVQMENDTGLKLRLESWRRALRCCDIEDEELVQQAVAHYARQREETVELSIGVFELLATLRGVFRTAIITNGPSDIQRMKLKRLKIEECAKGAPERLVDEVAISEEFGVGKPNPAIFLHVAAKLGVKPAECIMVGDSIPIDIVGAQAAGMHSVWINKNRRPIHSEKMKPDFIIEDIREILDLVGIKGKLDGNTRNTL